MKCITLCSCLFSSSRFSVSRVQYFGIVNRYSWLWKSVNMASKGYEFSFCGGNHAKIDMIKIDMSICISRMTTKFGEEVPLEELTQIKLIKQMLVTSLPLSTTRLLMASKLGRIVPYVDGVPPINAHDPLIMWSCEITWQIKTLYLHCRSANRYQTWQDSDYPSEAPTHNAPFSPMSGSHPLRHMTLWLRGYSRSRDKLKPLYLYYYTMSMATKHFRMVTHL